MKKPSIQRRMLFINVIFGFLPYALLLLILLFFVLNMEKEKRVSALQTDTESIVSTLNILIDNMVDTSFFLIGDRAVRDFMLYDEKKAQVGEYTSIYQNVIRTLNCMPYNTKSSEYIFLQSMDNRQARRGVQTVNSPYEITADERKMADDRHGGYFWSVNDTQIAICRKLRDIYDVRRGLGYIKVGMPKSDFEKIFRTDAVEYYMLLMDDQLLLHNMGDKMEHVFDENELSVEELQEEAAAGKGTVRKIHLQGNVYYLSSIMLDKQGLIFLNIRQDRRDYFIIMAALIMATIVLCTLLTGFQMEYVKRWIIRPLQKLSGLMSTIETQEDFTVRFNAVDRDEIGVLGEHFNRMAEKLDLLYNQVYESRIQLKEAELKALQDEIHPHFLFNTLSAIYWTIQSGSYENAANMVTDLSTMFQYSMSRDADGLVSIQHEVKHLESYLRLQKYRLKESFVYSIDVQENIGDCAVLKLILQPLVENGINHGILSQSGQGVLSVSIYTSEDTLYYLVYDNGEKADFKKINELLDPTREPDPGSHREIGLHNISRRIRLKFGSSYGVVCRQPADGGTLFVVTQPLRQMRTDSETQ